MVNSVSKFDLSLVIVNPAVENVHSDGTEVAGNAKYFLANLATLGNFGS